MAGVDETISLRQIWTTLFLTSKRHREEDSVNVIIRNLERGIGVFGSQSRLDVNVCALEALVRVFTGEFQSSNKLNVTCVHISIDGR